MAIYPKLVREKDCTTDIHVVLYDDDISEEGAPIILLEDDFKCNYQEKARRVLTKEKTWIQITGKAYFSKDIAPTIPTISNGKVTIFGEKRNIYQGIKARNPDGTFNYLELEII